MKKIPKIIHQTWKNDNIPEYLSILASTWKDNHPDWEYILWTDEMNLDFISENYPGFLSAYNHFAHIIQRVDAVRYFILYHMGGVFIDMDFECLFNIEPLINGHECVFGLEPDIHCEQHNKEIIICNAFMACTVENDFFKSICNEIATAKPETNQSRSWKEILESTGPFKLTEVYKKYAHKNKIELLPAQIIYPFSLDEIRKMINSGTGLSAEFEKQLEQAYAVHYFLGSWW